MPLGEPDVVALDKVIQALVGPRLLHHPKPRVQGLTLTCLREALRICRLCEEEEEDGRTEDKDEEGDAQASISSYEMNYVTQNVTTSVREPLRASQDIWATEGGETCRLIKYFLIFVLNSSVPTALTNPSYQRKRLERNAVGACFGVASCPQVCSGRLPFLALSLCTLPSPVLFSLFLFSISLRVK
jgi:hypothetical protein